MLPAFTSINLQLSYSFSAGPCKKRRRTEATKDLCTEKWLLLRETPVLDFQKSVKIWLQIQNPKNEFHPKKKGPAFRIIFPKILTKNMGMAWVSADMGARVSNQIGILLATLVTFLICYIATKIPGVLNILKAGFCHLRCWDPTGYTLFLATT